jgi:hypothetical protein
MIQGEIRRMESRIRTLGASDPYWAIGSWVRNLQNRVRDVCGTAMAGRAAIPIMAGGAVDGPFGSQDTVRHYKVPGLMRGWSGKPRNSVLGQSGLDDGDVAEITLFRCQVVLQPGKVAPETGFGLGESQLGQVILPSGQMARGTSKVVPWVCKLEV